MKNYDLVLIYNYNPFEKKQPYFYSLINGEEIIKGEGYSSSFLFNFILSAINSVVREFDFKSNVSLNVFVSEDDYEIYNLEKLIVNLNTLSNKYEAGIEMKEFLENLKRIEINFHSLAKFPKYKKIFKDEFNLHF